jgi:hypothetical protein
MDFLKRILTDRTVERKYVHAGAEFGFDVSYIYMGESIGFESRLNKWANWEKEYAKRGFRTVPLDDFIELGGYGRSIASLVGIKRDENEEPVYHAQIYRDNFLGKIEPAIDLEKMMSDGKVQYGTYVVPSTKSTPE